MSRFAIRFPYLVIVICLITCVVGVTSVVKMPVDYRIGFFDRIF